jgi:MFS family permease
MFRVGVLRDPAYRRLLGAEWVSLMGDFALIAVIPFVVKEQLGGSDLLVALVFGAEYLTLAAFVLVGGVAGDRFQRRTTMIGADLARFAALLLCGVALVANGASVWLLIAANLVLGVGSGFFGPALMGMVKQTVPDDTLQEANALRGIALATATMIGPALGGLVLTASNAGTAYIADALTFLLSAWLLSGLRLLPDATAADDDADEPSMWTSLREGWTAFWSRTWLWVVVLGFTVLNTAVFAPFFILGPDVMGGSASWSKVLAFRGLGAVLGGVVALVWRPRRPLRAAMVATALWIPMPLLMAGGSGLVSIAVAALIAGAGLTVFDACWEATMLGNIPEDQVSRVTSYDWLGGLGLLPLGYLLAAGMTASVGAASGLILGAAITAGTTVAVLTVPSVRNLRRVEDHAAAPTGEPLTDAA